MSYLLNNSLIRYIFLSPTGANVFSGTCLVVMIVGLLAGRMLGGGSFETKDNGRVMLLRKPWPAIMAVNVLGLYVIWLCIEMFIWSFPLAVSIPATAFLSALVLFPLAWFGTPETIKIDMEERLFTHTHGWFPTTRVMRVDTILGLDLRTLKHEMGTTYLCRLRWRKGLFGWSELGYFDKYETAYEFINDLSQKLQIPLSTTGTKR